MYYILAFILGGAVVTYLYETYHDLKDKKIGTILAPKCETLIEMSSKKIFMKQKELKRFLTEEEKNKILDDCYNEL